MMKSSSNVYRKNQNAPRTSLLLTVFAVTLVLLVVNQVFVNVLGRQEQIYTRQVADMRVLSLELARNASAVVTGESGQLNLLRNTRSEFASIWALFNDGQRDYLDTGLGINTSLPGKKQLIEEKFSLLPQAWERVGENIGMLPAVPEAGAAVLDATALDFNALALVAAAIVNDSELLLQELTRLDDYFAAGGREWFASPLIGYALLLVLLLTIGIYGSQVIRQSREAEQVSAEKNKRNNHAVLKLIGEISSLADGDLTVEATVGEDFTGTIADSVNYAVGQLRGLVSAITNVTLEVTSSADSSKQMVESLSEASQRQSTSIDSVYTSIRQISNSIKLVSDNAQKSLNVAENSVKTAAGGAVVVKDTIKGMDNIRDQIQDTSKRIKRLGESSQAIGGFVSLINDIAAHTNTLSLNAAIQAASAGDAGKGFAVVADEVHALAQRSSDATRQIESLVKVIQGDIKEAVQSMEQTTAEVVAGTGLARRAGNALDDIQQVSKELAELVSSITAATQNQNKAAFELSGSMEVIRQVTSKTSDGIEKTREFIMKLGDLTERLKLVVAGFSLSKKDKWTRFKKDKVTTMDQMKEARPQNLESDESAMELTRHNTAGFPARALSA